MTPFDLKNVNVLLFNNKHTVRDFSAHVNKHFFIKWEKTSVKTVSFLDSFDGRLFNAGYSVCHTDQNIYISSFNRNGVHYNIDWPNSNLPKLSSDFSDRQTEILFTSILDTRSLTKILALKLNNKPFIILNSNKKTIARGYFILSTSIYPNRGIIKTICGIYTLRGYANDIKIILNSLPEYEGNSDFGRSVLHAYKIHLRDYSKPVYALASKKTISEALYEILHKNFLIMRRNEKGIIDDVDIEFLHDFRVAGRRMRSALGLFKDVLDPVVNQMLRLDLKHIGYYSGPLRDLDVYLRREEEYKSLLPGQWPQKEVHAIFTKLKKQRKTAWIKMVNMLQSAEYRELSERWEAFFKNFDKQLKRDAPLLTSVSSMIMKRYGLVLKKGHKLSAKDDDEKFHDLRITCKKLRYLLEFFGSLYPEQTINKIVKQLKKLQENLGDFNDYSVQIETLNQMLTATTNNTEFIKTVAGLITVLNYKMHQLRNEFYTLFKQFSEEENNKLYLQLFKVNK